MNFKPYIKIIRPINFLITFITAIVAVLIADDGSVNMGIYILVAFSAAFTASAGNVINDIYDINIDKVNRPERPLASGEISAQAATAFYILLVFLSLIMAFYIGISAVFMVSIVNMLLTLYSSSFKRIPFVGNFIVALITGLVFIYGGLAAGSTKNVFIPAGFAFLINLIREILKDIEDIKGDTSAGIRTLPIAAGIVFTKRMILYLTVILIFFTFHPFIFNYYRIEYFVIVMVIVNPLMVYFLKSFYKDQSNQNLARLSLLLKLNMVFGLAAIFMGR